jgi:hypothetical protein
MNNDIGWAISSIKQGHTVQRPKWGAHTYIALCPADADYAPGITVGTALIRSPWLPCAEDLLATDWKLRSGEDQEDYGPPLGARPTCDVDICESCQ